MLVGIVAAGILGVSPLRAEERQHVGFAIDEWLVPPSCGEQGAFVRLVASAVGTWPEGLTVIRVKVRVSGDSSELALVLLTDAASGQGRRTLRGGSCEELLETAAVVLSLALDSEVLYDNERTHEVLRSSVSEPPSSHRQLDDGESPGLRTREIRAIARTRKRLEESLDTGVRGIIVGEVGTLPRPSLGVGIVVSAHSGPYRVAFQLTKWAEQVQFLEGSNTSGGRFDLITGSLQLCRDLAQGGGVRTGLCAQAHAGRMNAEGIAIAPRSATEVLYGAGVGAFLALPLQVRLQAEANAHRSSPRFNLTIDDVMGEDDTREDQFHQPSSIVIRLGLSWGLSF